MNSSLVFEYNTERVNLGNGFEMFFQNSDTNGCPIRKCSLMTGEGCKEKYVGKSLFILPADPWSIILSRDEVFGQIIKFCVSCSNGQ